MQGNRGLQQNHGPARQPGPADQKKPVGKNTNGQQPEPIEQSNPNEALTFDLQNFRKPGEKTFTQRSRLFVGNLPTGVTEEDLEKLFAKYGKVNEIFINKERGFGFIRLETRIIAEIARAELDDTPFRGRPIRVRFATHGAALTVKNLPEFVSNELLEEAFAVFGQIERAVVIVDDRGRPTGKGVVEFTSKPAARKALDKCNDGAYLLTAFPRPVTVEPMEQFDEEEGLSEKLINKNQQYHKEREQPPRFAQPGSFEYEYAMRWKALMEMEKQQYEMVDRNMKEAQEKLEAEMEAARHEHQVMLMRQDLLRRQEELRRMEELHSQEVQKRKQTELRQEEERRRREEDVRMRNEEMMKRQQEGFRGNFNENREQDMRMQMGGHGIPMNRNSMSGNSGPAGSTNMSGESAPLMQGPGNASVPGGGQSGFPRGFPGPGDYGPNKQRRF
ncbi:hypothetical protein LDENG_00042200 [Lucifuga dentata]|nr:hypothetical protein LDENG_00042200 [Lucifuga dentata]